MDGADEMDAPAIATLAGIRLADVAARAGVGESTVSRVLRSHGSYSEATRARVLEAASALGYVPNRIAGSLASSGVSLVALVVPSVTNVVFADLLAGVSEVLEPQGFQPVFSVTDYDPQKEERLIASMLAWRPAALLVAGREHTPAATRMLQASGRRIVELLDTDGPGLDCLVGFSNAAAGRMAAEHLMSRGYRRIGYVGHALDRDLRAAKRLAGFEAALAGSGLELVAREIAPEPSSIEVGRHGLARLLAREPRLDAVYFPNDDMAMGGYFHCLAAHVAVPGTLALFGHNGLEIGRAAPQVLSTILTPRAEIGRAAARLAIGGLGGERLDLGFSLVPGGTS
jgi:LacI family transcriptional regulator, gluconate utilization system Gnt-I transcriptional repressor